MTPVAAIKRKYEDLQAESADEHDLLGLLRTGSDEDAIKVFAHLRSSNDIQATLQQARNISDEPSFLTALPDPPLPLAYQASASQSYPQVNSASMDEPSIYPELIDPDGRTPWAFATDPYVCRLSPLVAPRSRIVVL